MNKSELYKEMAMSYDELVDYMHFKYGMPNKPYFCTQECKTKSKITRGNEGLYVHHVKETEIDDLSKPERAVQYSWEYQQPHNLCYCNYLEHLLLHVHINHMRMNKHKTFVWDGVLNHMVPEINYIYANNPVYEAKQTLWKNKVKELIIDNYNEYCAILTKWLEMIEEYNYYNITLEDVLSWAKELDDTVLGRIYKMRRLFGRFEG